MPHFRGNGKVMKGPDFPEMAGTAPGFPSFLARSRKRRSRPASIVRSLCLGVFGFALLFGSGFAIFATHISRLAAPDDLPNADAIIVLTGGQSRLEAALHLLKEGKGKRLLISGVNPVADREELRAATGGDKTLFSCCVDIDHAALDTIGNAQESAKWVDSHAYGSVILVTNNYHIPRSLLEMRRLIGHAELKPYPVVNSSLDGGGWLTKPEALRVLFMEYNKFLVSLARGVFSVSNSPHSVTVANAAAVGG